MAERNYLPQFMDRGKIYSSNARKPPGGDTNDIFGLEERQRERKIAIYVDKRMGNATAPYDKFQKKCCETEDLPSPRPNLNRKTRRSLSECRTKSDGPFLRTPPFATGKENIHSHFKRSLSPASKIGFEGKKLTESDDDDESLILEKQQTDNEVAGDSVDNSSYRSKLEDSTNMRKDENLEPAAVKTTRRPCIRVAQPPGGKSSIIF